MPEQPVLPGIPGSDYINAHGEEHSRLAGMIIDDISAVRSLLVGLVVVVFLAMAIITTNTVLATRTANEIKKLSTSGAVQRLKEEKAVAFCVLETNVKYPPSPQNRLEEVAAFYNNCVDERSK